ncbi:MAG TPA: type I-F CRISPR-associated endonuclease Cas1f, partial [Tahibacter sp.]|nr:type I-F CRISPR-associated endonuclease Cas1f [Tahibacter sp.]
RLAAAKRFQHARMARIREHWLGGRGRMDVPFKPAPAALEALLTQSSATIDAAPDTAALLTGEARLTKALFKLCADATGYGEFTRAKRGSGSDPANRFLDHGNYLAYGLAASACWVLGLPHGLAVLHGKTRRGGLVFDTADLVKDAIVLPQAFISAVRGDSEQEFRQACIETLTQTESLDFMIETLQRIALTVKTAGR